MVSAPPRTLSAERMGFNAEMPSPRALLGVAAAVASVGAVTAAARLGAVRMSALVGTPSEVADGKVWLPLTGALVADRPVALSLAAFALFAFATLAVCRVRVLVAAAVLGHLGATLLVYLGLAAVRAADPEAFENAVTHQDYGVSAMLAAWLGAIVFVAWRRRHDARERLAIVGFVALCTAVGWIADSRRTALDADHVVAFAIGIGVAGARFRVRLPRLARVSS
jgi:hypothetical protein